MTLRLVKHLSWLDGLFKSEVTPPLVFAGTGRQDDLQSTDEGDPVSAIALTGAAPDITGIADGVDSLGTPRRLSLLAVGGAVVLEEESPFSLPGNRIITGAGNVEIPLGAAVWLVYDASSSRWRLSGGSGGGSSANTILHGSSSPSGGTGANGDFFIDTTAHAIYGAKATGAWGSPTSLIGPTGATGAAGATGPAGDPTGFRLSGTSAQLAVSQQSGSDTTGIKFYVTEASLICTGFRFYAVVASSKTFKCSIWDAGGTRLTSVNVVVASTGIYTATFASPQTLTIGAFYRISIWQNDGANYTKATLAGLTGVVPARPFYAGQGVTIVDLSQFAAGDANPSGAAGTEAYLMEPTF